MENAMNGTQRRRKLLDMMRLQCYLSTIPL